MKIRAICSRSLLLLFAASVLAHADDINVAQVFVDPTSFGGTGPFEKSVSFPGTIDIGGSATGPASNGPVESGDGSAHVQYGKINLFASAFANLNAVTRGIFHDDLLITDPNVPVGTFLTVKYGLLVQGGLTPDDSGAGLASWSLVTCLGCGAPGFRKGAMDGSPATGTLAGYQGDPTGLYSVEQTVQSGIPALLSVQLEVDAQARLDNNSNPGGATGNFLDTLAWTGIQGVTVNGNPVDYSLSSTSGTDWNKSFVTSADTPEPASGVLVASVIAGVWLLRRRRDRNRIH